MSFWAGWPWPPIYGENAGRNGSIQPHESTPLPTLHVLASGIGTSKRHKGAVLAFAQTASLRHGTELFDIAEALEAGLHVEQLGDFAGWNETTLGLNSLPDGPLRKAT